MVRKSVDISSFEDQMVDDDFEVAGVGDENGAADVATVVLESDILALVDCGCVWKILMVVVINGWSSAESAAVEAFNTADGGVDVGDGNSSGSTAYVGTLALLAFDWNSRSTKTMENERISKGYNFMAQNLLDQLSFSVTRYNK